MLRNTDAIRTFSGKAHLSVGAGVSASPGHVGRVAEADFRAGDGGYAACYRYSCSKGVFQNISSFRLLITGIIVLIVLTVTRWIFKALFTVRGSM